MRVVADQGLQLQSKVEREMTGGSAQFSYRFAALGMTRHIPYRIERELAFLRLR